MPVDIETGLGEIIDGGNTPFQFEDPAAAVALKVMVVTFSRGRVQHMAAGHLDGGEPLFLHQAFRIAVDVAMPRPSTSCWASSRTSGADSGRSCHSKTRRMAAFWRVFRRLISTGSKHGRRRAMGDA